ncbi:dihydrofolate synthase [Cutibacterium acnes JCM 18909]|nr:dihydrofolate synthase [Cutibacterium acnes JCM 18909]
MLLAQCADAGVKPLLEGPDWGLLDRRSAIGGQVLRIQTASGPLGELFLPVFLASIWPTMLLRRWQLWKLSLGRLSRNY